MLLLIDLLNFSPRKKSFCCLLFTLHAEAFNDLALRTLSLQHNSVNFHKHWISGVPVATSCWICPAYDLNFRPN